MTEAGPEKINAISGNCFQSDSETPFATFPEILISKTWRSTPANDTQGVVL